MFSNGTSAYRSNKRQDPSLSSGFLIVSQEAERVFTWKAMSSPFGVQRQVADFTVRS
jgi:hypothetical protein